MTLKRVVPSVTKAMERFQRLRPLEKAAIAGVITAVVAAVLLSHGRAAVLFLLAVLGGGWAAVRTASDARDLHLRRLLPLLPDLVDRGKAKRPRAGLSVSPNFEDDLEKYSLKSRNNYQHRGRRKVGHLTETETERARSLSLWSAQSLSITVDEELQLLLKSIMVEFVMSWYGDHISSHGQVPGDFRRHLLSAGENVCARLASFSQRALFSRALAEFAAHVHRFQRARASLRRLRGRQRPVDSGSLVASYETFALMHPATEDAAAARDYLKAVARVILVGALPGPAADCRASSLVLVDIVASNVLLPLVALLADPDFLYRLILLIVSISADDPGTRQQDESDGASSELETRPSPASKLPEDSGLRPGDQEPVGSSSFQSQADSSVDGDRDAELAVDDIFEPRRPLPEIQRGSVRTPPLSPLTSRPNLTRVQSESCLPSPTSRHLLSRSLDSLGGDNTDQIRTPDAGSHSESLSGSTASTRSRGHRRTASDSLFNPVLELESFILGGLCPAGEPSKFANPAAEASRPGVTSPVDDRGSSGSSENLNAAGNSGTPRSGSDNLRTDFAVPMTTLEPARTLRSRAKRDERPKSWAGELEAAAATSLSGSDTGQAEVHLMARDLHRTDEGGASTNAAISAGDNAEERGDSSGVRLGPKTVENCLGAETLAKGHRRSTRADVDHHRGPLASPLPTDRPAASVPVAEPSSSFRKLLRKVSLSKRRKSGPAGSDTSTPRFPSVPTSHPVAIPIPACRSEAVDSTEPDRSPPMSAAQTREDVVGRQPTDRPRHCSGSAPDSLDMASVNGGTVPDSDLASWEVTNLTIPVTEVRKDIGGVGEFFLYVIQFDVSVSSAESSRPSDSRMGNRTTVCKTTKRRHREFVNLHSRLEHNPKLKQRLKGIKDVPRRLSIPIAPTAKTAVDQRRISLQHYLQQLLATPLLRSSAELAAFLALEGDTHIEYVRHQPREYVPRIDKLLRDRVSGLVDSFKSALPRALGDSAPHPSAPASAQAPTTSHQKTAPSPEAGRPWGSSPPASPRWRDPASTDEQDGQADNYEERIFAFERRPKTTLQLVMDSVIQDHNDSVDASFGRQGLPESAGVSINSVTSSQFDDVEPSIAVMSGNRSETCGPLESDDVALFDALIGLLREAFPDRGPWFVGKGFQQALSTLAGSLLDGWIERQINLLLSEHWCAFYLAELRESLWPNGKLLSGGEEAGTRSAADKETTRMEVLTRLLELMPESFYCFVDKDDWREGLRLLLDSLSDPHLNRHLVFVALDLLMDAVMAEVKDESYQKDLLARI